MSTDGSDSDNDGIPPNLNRLRDFAIRDCGSSSAKTLTIHSFGHRFGPWSGSPLDAQFNARTLPNPPKHIRASSTGLSKNLQDSLHALSATQVFLENIIATMKALLDNKDHVIVAVGCEMGRHRSVAICEQLSRVAWDSDVLVEVHHRDLHRNKKERFDEWIWQGNALFERVQGEEIGQELEDVQKAALDLATFGRYIKLKSFAPLKSAAHALENIMDVNEGIVNDLLKSFLELNLPKGKKTGVQLGVGEKNLAGQIKSALEYDCVNNETVLELIRGLCLHGDKLLRQLKEEDFYCAQLGLGHAYSRAEVKFNVNRKLVKIANDNKRLDKRLKIDSNFAKMVIAGENEEGEVLLAASTVVATSGNRKSTEDEGEKSKKKKKKSKNSEDDVTADSDERI
ncbi:snoRNP complex protein nop56 [Entophlyctis luteolus]|nr:snoRNP complex protein nop56 [Entophlyctis luteolus]